MTPREMRNQWATHEAVREAALGRIEPDQIDRYAELLEESMQGQLVELRFALDQLKRSLREALPAWLRRLVG